MIDRSPAITRRFTGWGHSTGSVATLVAAADVAELAQLITSTPRPGLLARGLGRAYGDAATNAGGVLVAPFQAGGPLTIDAQEPSVTAPAGVSLDLLLRRLLPLGLMLPVVPGTRHVSLGGAIAADVHGKNHHVDSSFGRWVQRLTLVDGLGEVRQLSADCEPEAFWATIGGMGLTGVIVSATVRLIRVSSAQMRVTTTRLKDFDELLSRLSTRPGPRYQVAWVDPLAAGPRRYRAVLDEGEHAESGELPAGSRSKSLRWPASHPIPAPPLPANIVRGQLARPFNALWWRRAPAGSSRLIGLGRFFFPLDGVAEWHRLYGPRGFLQYQIVLPLSAESLLRTTLDRLRAGGLPSLVVLKRMGQATPGQLSFPFDGWTLAVDLPATGERLFNSLRDMDKLVAGAGGRVYLAKDSRMSPDAMAAMYPRLQQWRSIRSRLDPERRFESDLARRLQLL